MCFHWCCVPHNVGVNVGPEKWRGMAYDLQMDANLTEAKWGRAGYPSHAQRGRGVASLYKFLQREENCTIVILCLSEVLRS